MKKTEKLIDRRNFILFLATLPAFRYVYKKTYTVGTRIKTIKYNKDFPEPTYGIITKLETSEEYSQKRDGHYPKGWPKSTAVAWLKLDKKVKHHPLAKESLDEMTCPTQLLEIV